jgi:hypothetical protein
MPSLPDHVARGEAHRLHVDGRLHEVGELEGGRRGVLGQLLDVRVGGIGAAEEGREGDVRLLQAAVEFHGGLRRRAEARAEGEDARAGRHTGQAAADLAGDDAAHARRAAEGETARAATATAGLLPTEGGDSARFGLVGAQLLHRLAAVHFELHYPRAGGGGARLGVEGAHGLHRGGGVGLDAHPVRRGVHALRLGAERGEGRLRLRVVHGDPRPLLADLGDGLPERAQFADGRAATDDGDLYRDARIDHGGTPNQGARWYTPRHSLRSMGGDGMAAMPGRAR